MYVFYLEVIMAENKVPIYLDLPAEVQKALSENHINIGDILQQKNITAQVKYGSIPSEEEEDARSKDVATIIMVSGASALLVMTAVVQVLNAVWHRPRQIEVSELEPIKDEKGKILLTKKGKPRMRRVVRQKLLQPYKTDQKQDLEIHFDLKNGLVIRFVTEQNQVEKKDEKA